MTDIIDTKDQCLAVADLLDGLDGLPARGVHIGEGRHVDMPESWDGEGDVPPGWTSYRGGVAPADGVSEDYVLALPVELEEKMAAGSERLSAREVATLSRIVEAARAEEAVSDELTAAAAPAPVLPTEMKK